MTAEDTSNVNVAARCFTHILSPPAQKIYMIIWISSWANNSASDKMWSPRWFPGFPWSWHVITSSFYPFRPSCCWELYIKVSENHMFFCSMDKKKAFFREQLSDLEKALKIKYVLQKFAHARVWTNGFSTASSQKWKRNKSLAEFIGHFVSVVPCESQTL